MSGRSLLNALATRIVAMLALVLLPLGAVAVYQTVRVADQINSLTEAAMLGRTSDAVDIARQQIQRGFGVAKSLGQTVLLANNDDEACSEFMRRIVDSDGGLVFAGYIDTGAQMNCASMGAPRDLTDSKRVEALMAAPRPVLQARGAGAITGLSVLLINHPAFEQGDLRGFITLSIPRSRLRVNTVGEEGDRPEKLFLFNQDGAVLASDQEDQTQLGGLPLGRDLSEFVTGEDFVFRGTTRDGQERTFTVLSIVPNTVYALGVWSPKQKIVQPTFFTRVAATFPALMWFVSLVVAYFAVHRLVIKHIAELRTKMSNFAGGKRTLDMRPLSSAPEELQEMDRTFLDMADTIVRDEAAMEDSLHEKNVLLKEVHHRVKNNLQLISSIINMQVRKSKSPEATAALRQVQDRVLGLATIHRNLYMTQNLSQVRADQLLGEIVDQLLILALPAGVGVETKVSMDPVTIYPDQAVPLSLLTSELATNALKYIGRPEGRDPWVRVELKELEGQMVRFEVSNSLGTPLVEDKEVVSTGLGKQLIRAFAMQLESDVETDVTDDSHTISVVFKIADFAAEDAEDAEELSDAPQT